MSEIYDEIKKKEGEMFGKRCAICGRDDGKYMLIDHHINYDPEEIIKVCRTGCHSVAPQLQFRPSVEIYQDVHIRIKERQIELIKQGKGMKIAEIVNEAILKGLLEV